MTAERFHCPLRPQLPSSDKQPPDQWVLHWGTGSEREAMSPGYTIWRWHWTPLACSNCGGLRPEDASRLMAEGWESETTQTHTALLLHPPGYWQCHEDMIREIHSNGIQGWRQPQGQWAPRPPALARSEHFTPDSQEAFWRHQELSAVSMARLQ